MNKTLVASKNFIETIVDLIKQNRITFAGKDIINIYSTNMRDVMITLVFEPLQNTRQAVVTVDHIVVYTSDDSFIVFIVDPKNGEMLYNKAAERLIIKKTDIIQSVQAANHEPTR